MKKISIKNFKALIKEKRPLCMNSPYELVYASFIELGYEKKSKIYFQRNANSILKALRNKCWENFVQSEKNFTTQMLKELIDENLEEQKMSSVETLHWYIDEYADHIYNLSLSNTQSRRSRAGKEFEAIVELILIGAGIPLDSQGNIGKPEFLAKGLGKAVDFVIPGEVQFFINSQDSLLLSVKTTLRERWQEVAEEMNRTGAREMFLMTLDSNISKNILETLKALNIQVVAPFIKNHLSSQVLSFEQFIDICLNVSKKWENYPYSLEERQQIIHHLENEISKKQDQKFLRDYYEDQLKSLEENSSKKLA